MTFIHLRNTINFFIGRVTAFICALFIFLLSATIIASWVNESLSICTRMIAPSPSDSGSRFAGHITALLLLLAPILYCGVAFGRFLLRAAPPRLSGRVQFSTILLTIPLAIACALFSGTFLYFLAASN